jgi:hypothetical protein
MKSMKCMDYRIVQIVKVCGAVDLSAFNKTLTAIVDYYEVYTGNTDHGSSTFGTSDCCSSAEASDCGIAFSLAFLLRCTNPHAMATAQKPKRPKIIHVRPEYHWYENKPRRVLMEQSTARGPHSKSGTTIVAISTEGQPSPQLSWNLS